MVYLLGMQGQLVGVTHECDYPSEASLKPRVTRTTVVQEGMTGSDIDSQVSALAHSHRSIYELDIPGIRELQPDLILTQEICEVCAVSRQQVEEAALELYGTPNVVSLEPSTLAGVLENIRYLGELTGTDDEAARQVDKLSQRLNRIRESPWGGSPSVVCLEWLQPPMVAGHWLPEMIEIAGGEDALAETGQPSRRIEWEELREADPDIVLIAPCGYSLTRGVEEYRSTPFPDCWRELRAVHTRQVFAIDGKAYTSRPGPRLIDGLEIIATILRDTSLTSKHYGVDYVRVG